MAARIFGCVIRNVDFDIAVDIGRVVFGVAARATVNNTTADNTNVRRFVLIYNVRKFLLPLGKNLFAKVENSIAVNVRLILRVSTNRMSPRREPIALAREILETYLLRLLITIGCIMAAITFGCVVASRTEADIVAANQLDTVYGAIIVFFKNAVGFQIPLPGSITSHGRAAQHGSSEQCRNSGGNHCFGAFVLDRRSHFVNNHQGTACLIENNLVCRIHFEDSCYERTKAFPKEKFNFQFSQELSVEGRG